MKAFLMRCFVLIAILFVALLAGMQLASEGLQHMTREEQVVSTIEGDVILLEKEFRVEEKQKQLEDIKSFNVFAKLGDGLAVSVQNITEASTNVVVEKISNFMERATE